MEWWNGCMCCIKNSSEMFFLFVCSNRLTVANPSWELSPLSLILMNAKPKVSRFSDFDLEI